MELNGNKIRLVTPAEIAGVVGVLAADASTAHYGRDVSTIEPPFDITSADAAVAANALDRQGYSPVADKLFSARCALANNGNSEHSYS